MAHPAGAVRFLCDILRDGEGKEMAWSELIGWMGALTQPTRGSSW